MGCQRDIAQKIIDKKADYVLALKGNQGSLRVDGGLNPRLSGAGGKLPRDLVAPTWLRSFLPKPFIPGHRTDGG
jgi:hypothetical protein